MRHTQGRTEIVSLLLDHGGDASAKSHDGWTPLMCAAFRDHPDTVQLLLKKGCGDVDFRGQGQQGRSALWLACSRGHSDVVGLLLSEGRADYTLPDVKDKKTPLEVARTAKHMACVRLIEVRGRDEQTDTTKSVARPWNLGGDANAGRVRDCARMPSAGSCCTRAGASQRWPSWAPRSTQCLTT